MIFLHRVCGGPGGVRVALSGDLDLDDVTFLDCAGIKEFIRAYSDAHGRGHMLTVSRPHGIVRRILELTGVLDVLMPDGRPTAPHRLDVPHSA
jgi:anti-anti-sigma factor